MPIYGIDVSHHQGSKLDWDRIRAAGFRFMIARASLATTPDGEYRSNHRRAKQAGLDVLGAYHFLYPRHIVSPVAQAELFVDRIGDPAGMLTMLDIERDRQHKPRIGDVRVFAARFAKLTGGHPLLLYAPAWYWHIIGNPDAAEFGPLVASHYVPVTQTPTGHRIRMTAPEAYAKVPRTWWRATHGGWSSALILQFTSSGKVAGHRGSIDFDAFRGTVAQLAALTAASGVAVPAPKPKPKPHRSPGGDQTPPARFYDVAAGDTLVAIAARFGWRPKGRRPAYRVMLSAFPENQSFRKHPDLIYPGDRVRVG